MATVGDRRDVHVGLAAAVDQVARADESGADHADAHAIAGRRASCLRRHHTGRCDCLQKRTPTQTRAPPNHAFGTKLVAQGHGRWLWALGFGLWAPLHLLGRTRRRHRARQCAWCGEFVRCSASRSSPQSPLKSRHTRECGWRRSGCCRTRSGTLALDAVVVALPARQAAHPGELHRASPAGANACDPRFRKRLGWALAYSSMSAEQ